METKPLAGKQAKKHKSPHYYLTPILPGKKDIGPLKDMAQEIIAASSGLEGKVAKETSFALGDKVRLINSYYSNLIEGHKTTIHEIEMALKKEFSKDPDAQYAQELCSAHVLTEKMFMQTINTSPKINICSQQFLSDIHAAFYANLPKKHLYTHTSKGFTRIPVEAGVLRDKNVSVDDQTQHGPDYSDLPELIKAFAKRYDPNRFYGDERVISMAASHHRLTWLHPFRDGNGRVVRLFSGLYLSRIGVNKSNLWSLSRGLSRNKKRYMFNLWATDSPGDQNKNHFFSEELLSDFCEFFFEICLDQIRFMENLLRLDQIDSRIDWYVESRTKDTAKPLHPESAKLLRAVFMRGAIARGKASEIMNMSERNARRIVSVLLKQGLLESTSHRAPLTIGLPIHVLPFYFPDLYDPSVMGDAAKTTGSGNS